MLLTTNDLPQLCDIIKDIIHIDEHTEKDKCDLIETIHIFINDILEKIPRLYEKYDFEDRLYELVYQVFTSSYQDEMEIFDRFCIHDIITESMHLYFCINKPRSYHNTFYPTDANYEILEKHIQKNMKKKQPEQQTKEWYSYRHTMLTASSIWKALAGEGVQNNLIYQKCLPYDKNSKRGVNVNSAMHWGHKYEPLSILLYEEEHKTKIAEVGCVKHDTIPFLGASPDGINIKRTHPLYGRAIEIKNPVSRELSGIPKFDYWIQMQLQMEVWNFEEVDFLETVFKEYDCEEDFTNDGSYKTTKIGKQKGIIVVFSGEQPIYEYMPFNLSKDEGGTWIENIIDKHTPQYTWIQNIYWYLDDVSCVLVPRNKDWFASALPCFRKIWKIIERERINGYGHRAPKKKEKRAYLKISKSVQTQTKDENFNTTILEPNNIKVFRIRTESFDQAKTD